MVIFRCHDSFDLELTITDPITKPMRGHPSDPVFHHLTKDDLRPLLHHLFEELEQGMVRESLQHLSAVRVWVYSPTLGLCAIVPTSPLRCQHTQCPGLLRHDDSVPRNSGNHP